MITKLVNVLRRPGSHDYSGRVSLLVPATLIIALMMGAATGCGSSSSKPAYCSDRSSLENSVKGLTTAATTGGVSGLQSQVTTIQSDATKVVSSAKSDFPSETSSLKATVDQLVSSVKALPASPSTSQLAAIAINASAVVNSVKSFTDATSSNCS